MPLTLVHESEDLFRLDVSGLLTKAELDRTQQLLLESMRAAGTRTARLLVVLEHFDGWTPDEHWNDLTFYVAHGDDITRIAFVGEERWRSYMLMFAAADLRKGPVEYFLPGALADARAWLQG